MNQIEFKIESSDDVLFIDFEYKGSFRYAYQIL